MSWIVITFLKSISLPLPVLRFLCDLLVWLKDSAKLMSNLISLRPKCRKMSLKSCWSGITNVYIKMHNSSHKETCLIVNNLRMLTHCLIIHSAFRKRMSNRNNIFWIVFGLCIILQSYIRLAFSTTNCLLWWWREWDSNPRTPKGRDDSYAIPFSKFRLDLESCAFDQASLPLHYIHALFVLTLFHVCYSIE